MLYYSCVMFSLLRLRVLYFPCYVEVSLDSNLERKKKLPKIFQIMLSRMDKCNLVVSTNILLFDVLTMLIHHLVLFFSFLSLKINFLPKAKKKILSKAIMFFFVFFVGWTNTLIPLLFIKLVSE